MANHGKVRLTYVITAPPDQVEEGKRIFASHGPWMEATHPRDGSAALITYDVSITPELSNPLDASSAPTGNTCFVLTEIYETPDGVSNHFQEAMDTWQDFPAFVSWLENCTLSGVPVAPIVNSLW